MQPDEHDILTLVLGVLDREPDANRILGDLLEESGHIATAQWARAKKTKIRQRLDLALAVLPPGMSLGLVTDFVDAWTGQQLQHSSGVLDVLTRRPGRMTRRIRGLLESAREWLTSIRHDAESSGSHELAEILEQLELVSFDEEMRLTLRTPGSSSVITNINPAVSQHAEQLFSAYAAAVRKFDRLKQEGQQLWVNEELSGYMRRAAALAVYRRPDDLVTQFKLVRHTIVLELDRDKAGQV